MNYYLFRSSNIEYDSTLRLSDGRVTLRTLTPDDTEEFDRAITESLSDLTPWLSSYRENHSISDTRHELDLYKQQWESDISYNFAITNSASEKILGFCKLNRIDTINHVANIGYWVRSKDSGKGIASTAALLLSKWALDSCGFHRIEFNISQKNKRSIRVAEKAGAHFEGVLRKKFTIDRELHDVLIYSFIQGDI